MNEKHCTHCSKVILKKVHPNTVKPFCSSVCYGLWQKGLSFSEQGKPTKTKRFCDIEGCGMIHFGRGYCRKHYLQIVYCTPKVRNPKKESIYCCKQCGKEFIAYHAEPKFCSRKCSGEYRKQPFILKKGYKKILLPTHPRADGKGYVFEHIIISEAALGRPLKQGEVVHHKDFNKQNNQPCNLLVCSSHSEHMKLHL